MRYFNFRKDRKRVNESSHAPLFERQNPPDAAAVVVYEVVTFHKTVLMTDQASGSLCHGVPGSLGLAPVYACIPPGAPSALLLYQADKKELCLEGEAAATLLSLRVASLLDGTVSLIHPLNHHLVCALEGKSGEGSDGRGEIVANRVLMGQWETFALHPVDVPSALVEALAGILAIFEQLTTGASVLAYLRASPTSLPPDWLNMGMRLLPVDQIEWLGRELARDRAAAEMLAKLMPEDIWAATALPALARQRAEGPSAKMLGVVDTACDHLQHDGVWGQYKTAGHMLNSFARRSMPATQGICVLASARNEGLYLLEWIAYHRALGVDTFFIYTNENDDGSDDLLRALADAGVIYWINNRTRLGVSPQLKAYGHALQILPDILNYRWAAIIDVDEFIVIDNNRFRGLGDFIQFIDAQKADAIALNWLMFTSAGQERRGDQLVTERFQQRASFVNPHVKSLARPNMFVHARCHYPMWDNYTSFVFRNGSGLPHPQVRVGDASSFAPDPADVGAWINHYYCKSAEEFILRRASSRGDVILTLEPSGDLFSRAVAEGFIIQHHAQDTVVDNRIARCVPELVRDIASLRSLPGVDAAMTTIEETYKTRLVRLSNVLSADYRFTEAGSPETWFADILNSAAIK